MEIFNIFPLGKLGVRQIFSEDSKPKCDTSGENIMKNTAGLPSGWGA